MEGRKNGRKDRHSDRQTDRLTIGWVCGVDIWVDKLANVVIQ